MSLSLSPRFALKFDRELHRRRIGGMEVIIHCHHYNARLQKTIEEASSVAGKTIIVSTAEAVFARHLRSVLEEADTPTVRWQAAAELYAHLGYGRLDFSQVAEGVVTASASHFAEGWRASFGRRTTPVCSFAEGYIQGAIAAVVGRPAHVRETECIFLGAPVCRFEVDTTRTEPLHEYERRPATRPTQDKVRSLSATIDEERIIDALVEMPIVGNEQGLIPAFNVYLANTPADFYNLVALRFIEGMERANLGAIARSMLVECAESCAMNTFRGILASAEWDALIAPMVKQPTDRLFGLVAVSNALGWGNWQVVEHTAEKTLQMASRNGYEAVGHLELRGASTEPACMMLTGVATGMMELLYGQGSVQERLGQFTGVERSCCCVGAHHCAFEVEVAA